MATAVSNPISVSSSSGLIEAKSITRQAASASPQCVSLPLMSVRLQTRISRTSAYCGKVSRNVAVMASGDVPTATATAPTPPETVEVTVEETGDETPEILKTVQETWDKVEDKYAVSSLAVAATLALVASSGVISAIDRLPLIPGVLELVGIGYTGWFAYKNLLYTPDREELIKKIKDTYKNVNGSS